MCYQANDKTHKHQIIQTLQGSLALDIKILIQAKSDSNTLDIQAKV